MGSVIPQFLIVFREGLEAALIVGIVAAYLEKTGRVEYKRYLYQGLLAAVAVSLVFGVAVYLILGGLDKHAERVFEGVASLTAAGVLTYMIFWMGRTAKTIRVELESKVSASIESNKVIGIFSLSFVSVLREGLETVLFLSALVVSDPLGTAGGVVAGFSVVIVLAVLAMGAVAKINPANLFKYTSVILIIFAAGLLGYGVHELVEAYEEQIPTVLIQEAWDINPDNPEHLLHEKGAVGSLLKTLIGYDGNPEVIRVIVYLAYWLITGTYIARTYFRKTLPFVPTR